MTKLEEIARAINPFEWAAYDQGRLPVDHPGKEGLHSWAQARDVLSTLKTPTPGMIEAACHDAVWDNLENRLSGDISKRIYRAMIDAAEGG